MAESGRLELHGDYIYRHVGLYSTTVTYLASKAMEFGEKREIRAITPFKVRSFHVIEVGINRKLVYATYY